jgi:CheY-specific phosphatase CheX
MTELPDAELLAALVSNVTETMCGISFSPEGTPLDEGAHAWRVASLPISGDRPLRVVLSSDQKSCEGLGSALLHYPAAELDPEMIDDSLCELLNMAAGQIKRALSIDQALGLPKIVPGAAGQALFQAAKRAGILLRSRGPLDLLIWVTEEPS